MQSKFLSIVSTGALFGALGMASQSAVAVTVNLCPGQTTGPERSSVVPSFVIPGSPNTYVFGVCNTSASGSEGQTEFLLRDWELPYDAAGGIANLTAPMGWGAAIETIGSPNNFTGWDGVTPTWFNPTDPFYDPRYLGLTQVIHFYTCGNQSCQDATAFGAPLFPGEGLAGFSFTSPFGLTNAPYQASWIEFLARSGDPAFPNPGGPNTPGLLAVNMPEPGSLALFAVALGALMVSRVRRRESFGD